MPIRPENKDRYPSDWKEIRSRILERAGNKCEWCGVANYAHIVRKPGGFDFVLPDERDDSVRVVLTIAHLDHTPENNDPDNLKALCQQCHNRYDLPMRKQGIRERARKAAGQTVLFEEATP